nr:hypothetical protein Itr_chr01CG10720 [Ipomoea trifida]
MVSSDLWRKGRDGMAAVAASTEERTVSAERWKRSTRKWSPQICIGKASRVCGRSKRNGGGRGVNEGEDDVG